MLAQALRTKEQRRKALFYFVLAVNELFLKR
jgi:hypothetical protein